MSTTPEAAERSGATKTILGLLVIAGAVGIYIYSWFKVIGAIGDPFPGLWPTLVGLAAPVLAFWLVDKLGFWLALTIGVGVSWLTNDSFEDKTRLGSEVLIVVLTTLLILGFMLVAASKGGKAQEEASADLGDLTTEDTAEWFKSPATPGRIMVGLSGYAGAGKDTAAEFLVEVHGFTRVSFADKLREFALAQNDFVPVVVPGLGEEPDQQTWMRLSDFLESCGGDWTLAKKNLEVRRMLQATGTDAGRKVIGENVWVDAVMNNLPEGDLVFTDLRFPNEYESIVGADGIVVRINRPGSEPVNAHVSETALDDHLFHATITNAGQPWELGETLAKFVGAFTGKESMLA